MTTNPNSDTPPWAATGETPLHSDPSLFERLRKVERDCGPDASSPQRVTALIGACLAEGIQSEGQIVAVIANLGFNHRHVGAVLNGHAGVNVKNHLWRKGPNRTFQLNEAVPAQPRQSAAHITVPTKP